jgi:hypothetical protein
VALSDARNACVQCLGLIRGVIPYRYAHWLIEDPKSRDYRVIASVLPEGETGYGVAHRTGVIGQVFRVEMPILVSDAGNHPLYDPFDNTIDWELCFPVFMDGRAKAVINLEGSGSLEIAAEGWNHICEVVQQTTGYHPPITLPQSNNSYLVKTRRIVIRGERSDEVAELARVFARGGESTLLVGNHPDLLGDRTPTMTDALRQGLGASYCYFGVERRLDLLATGDLSSKDMLENRLHWWNISQGRYAYVLVHAQDSVPLNQMSLELCCDET